MWVDHENLPHWRYADNENPMVQHCSATYRLLLTTMDLFRSFSHKINSISELKLLGSIVGSQTVLTREEDGETQHHIQWRIQDMVAGGP